MKTTKTLTILFLIMLTSTVALAQAEIIPEPVQLGEYSGSWEKIQIEPAPNYADLATNKTIFLGTYGAVTEGSANFTITPLANVPNDYGVIYSVDASIDAQCQGWGASKEFYLAMQFKGADKTSIYQLFHLSNTENLLMQGDQYAKFGIYQNNTAKTFDRGNAHFWIQFMRLNDTAVSVYSYQVDIDDYTHLSSFQDQIEDIYNRSRMVYKEIFTVNSTFWTNVDINLYTAHSGSGFVTANITEIQRGYMLPLSMDFSETDIGGIMGGNPMSWWDQLSALAGGLWSACLFVKDVLIFMLPYTPYIVIGLCLFALYSCWKAKSVEPIQNFVNFIWGLILGVINVFAHVVDVIRNLFRI